MSFGNANGSMDFDDDEVIELKDEPVNEKRRGHPTTPHQSSPGSSASGGRRKTTPQLLVTTGETREVLLSDIFGVEDKTYDVTLYSSLLVLTIVSGKIKASSGRKMSVKRIDGDKMEIWIKDLFGADIRRIKSKPITKLGPCQGVELYTYSEKGANKLKHKDIFLAHPSEEICRKWVQEIQRILNTIVGRPKSAKFYINVDSSAVDDFQTKIRPIFFQAQLITVDVEVNENAEIAKDVETSDLSQYDCVIVAGDDSTVNTVVDSVLKKVQFDNGIVLGGKENLQSSNLPIGVIPVGDSTVIAHTVHGTSDMVTAGLDIVYGRTLMSDILSVSYSQGDFYKFAFSAQYGFGGTVMNLVAKSRLVSNKYQLAIAKSLTKSKLRSYSCEMKYNLAPSSVGHPSDGKACRAGCLVCNNDSNTPCPDGSSYSDPLQEFNPLDGSNSSSQLSELTAYGSSGESLKGEFLSVSLYSTASPCDMAPLGLSKYTHIADGSMDLILVRSTERKEFMRFLKRNGNSKNQLDFPFVESHRVREVSFHVRMPVSWNYRDKNYCEIDDQVRQQETRLQSVDESIKVIADGDTTIISDLKLEDSFDDDDSMSSNDNSATTTSLSEDQSSQRDLSTPQDAAGHVHAIHKYTDTDRRLKKKKAKDLQKEMKAKAKEEKDIKSIWRLDSTSCAETDLTFRVHQKMVTFYGSGMSENTAEEDVFCFPAI